jgi:hypothetical protein
MGGVGPPLLLRHLLLGHRLWGGGESAKLHAKASLRRAVALDPGRLDAANDLINIESDECGKKAHDSSSIFFNLLRPRPNGSAVHLLQLMCAGVCGSSGCVGGGM